VDSPPHRKPRRGATQALEDGQVATGAENILAISGPPVPPLVAPASRSGHVPNAAEAARAREASEHPTEDLRAEVDLELRDDRASIAAIRSDLASVHLQLAAISAGIIGLQSHSLRQTGMFALALAVLIAIAWKVVEG
jgi:hypothetical protein